MASNEENDAPNGIITTNNSVSATEMADSPETATDDPETSSQKSDASDSEAKSEWDPNIPVPPDGGWGWVVVFASFMIHVIADGIVYSFGIFYVEFLEYFESGKGDTAWIASLMVGITFVTGPIASAFVNRFGCRFTTMMGAVVGSCGFILSIFAPNIYVLYVTFGLIGGLGLGLIYLPAIVSVGQYFEKKRSFATGLAVCGSGVGTFVFAPLSQVLLDHYGWKGATMILTGLLLNCVLLGALFRPLYSENELKEKAKKRMEHRQRETLAAAKRHREERAVNGQAGLGTPLMLKEKRRLLNEDSFSGQKIGANDPQYFCSLPVINPEGVKSSPLLTVDTPTDSKIVTSDTHIDHLVKRQQQKDLAVHKHSHYHHMSTVVTPYSAYAVKSEEDLATMAFMSNHALHVMSISTLHVGPTEDDKSKSGCTALLQDFKVAFRQMTDLSLLKNPLFVMFAISNLFTSIGFNAPYIYLPDQAHLLGIPEQKGAFLISVIGIANTVGRILFGFLSDRIGHWRLHLYNTALLLCGICTALSPLCLSYPWLAAYAASYGLFVGTYVTLTAILLVDLLGLEHLVNSFGLLLLFQGAATLIGPPMLGWVFDGTGSYEISFIIAGVMIAVSGAMLYTVPCVQKLMDRRKAKKLQIKNSVQI
ncbi:monocarboxylate transporter 12-B-like [Lineus longissimus]|uniref:monocarboxylate transporter 12-B-like n=1 Tax=Lineus longissimus TaxID=88925 RepID=UPI002B4D17EA